MDKQRILSVSELTGSVRGLLETHFPFVRVAGEISNLRRAPSGHYYFTLKDSTAQLKAVLFTMQQRYLAAQPRDGQQVVCSGRLSVYEQRGDYQLLVDTMDFYGAGALQLAFEQLKQRLAREGLFDSARKRPLPTIPQHITLITSPRGAAVHDFIRVAHKRFPAAELAIYPVTVQGASASAEISAAISAVNDWVATDLIVLCRGGGSIEDLWPFNEEKVARAIAASRLPVVNAVGHEIDFTIADFVADLRAPTPSAAAEMILPDREALRRGLEQTRQKLTRALTARLESYGHRLTLLQRVLSDRYRPLDNLVLKLDHQLLRMILAERQVLAQQELRLARLTAKLRHQEPLAYLARKEQRVAAMAQRLHLQIAQLLNAQEKKLATLAGILDAVSPLATLARGYSITKRPGAGGEIIRTSNQVSRGEELEIILGQGSLKCIVAAKKE